MTPAGAITNLGRGGMRLRIRIVFLAEFILGTEAGKY